MKLFFIVLFLLVVLNTQLACLATSTPSYEEVNDLKRLIEANWYPVFTLKRQGQSVVCFKLLKNGHFADLRLMVSSGVYLADQAALRAIVQSTPYRAQREELLLKAVFGRHDDGANSSGIVSGKNGITLMVMGVSYLDEARTYYLSRHWSEARDAFSTVLMFDPFNPEAIYKKAVCDLYYYGEPKWAKIRRKKYEQSLSELSRAMDMYRSLGDSGQVLKISKWMDEVETSLVANKNHYSLLEKSM